MLVAGALCGVQARLQPLDRLVAAAELGQRLRRHLVGGDVVGTVPNERGELAERLVGLPLGGVGHGQPVAGEGVGGVLFKYLREKSNTVHNVMVRRRTWSWQASAIYTYK